MSWAQRSEAARWAAAGDDRAARAYVELANRAGDPGERARWRARALEAIRSRNANERDARLAEAEPLRRVARSSGGIPR